MDHVRVKTVGVAADQGRLSCQRKLHVALGKGIFGSLSIGNVACQALDAQQPALLVKLGFCCLLQPYLAAIASANRFSLSLRTASVFLRSVRSMLAPTIRRATPSRS